MKFSKRVLAVVMMASVAFSVTEPVVAIDKPSEKEEVIYVNLSGDGTVKDIYAVNIFGSGSIIDYGDYSSVEMLNVNTKITQDGELITFKSEEGRVYYKGKMKDTIIPWDISLKYYMDGKEYTATDVAGKSGKLEIHFKVTKNDTYQGNFFDNYALQATFTLDTEKCSDIEADGATVANVGSNKQLMYTMLPGEGIDTFITADVNNFEMSAVAINGIPLALNVEVDDTELMSKVTELLDAIKKLDAGAGNLEDGISDLKTGAEGDLQTGVHELTQGMASLNEGIVIIENGLGELDSKSTELSEGSTAVRDALTEIQVALSQVSMSTEQVQQLVEGSASISSGIDGLVVAVEELKANVSYEAYKTVMSSNGLDITQVQAENANTIAALSSQIETLNQQIAYLQANNGDANTIAQLQAQVKQLSGIVTLLTGNTAAINGMESYLAEINNNIDLIVIGVEELKANYALVDGGINVLAEELANMAVNMSRLKRGIDTLVAQYGKLHTGITQYTDGVAEILAGYSELAEGAKVLLGGTGKLDDGVEELISGISELYDGTGELKDGTSELYEKTDGMDTEISDKIDELLGSITGDNTEIESFVSDRNTNVLAVQFVIQTEAIDVEEIETVVVEEKEQLNFWQKLLRLFGLY